MNYSPELILKVNEVYHDVEGTTYQYKHSEIFVDEKSRWQSIGRQFIATRSRPLCLLDIGTGTGFVPLEIRPFLDKEDCLICSDISSEMLQVCERNLKEMGVPQIIFLKLDGKSINLQSNSVDVVTLNSVLHHLPEFSKFFSEVDRVLKLNGLIVIGHEPNKRFFSHPFLWWNYRIVDYIVRPKQIVGKAFRKTGLINPVNRLLRRSDKNLTRDIITHKVNSLLHARGVVDEPLTYPELIRLVDYHSPTAGDFDRSRGIDLFELLNSQLSNYQLEYIETYRHLAKVSTHNTFTRSYDAVLNLLLPHLGSTFLSVIRKNAVQ